MICEKKEMLIKKGLLRNQQPRFFMKKIVWQLIDELTALPAKNQEEIREVVDECLSQYRPEWYQLEAQLPAMQEQDRFLCGRFASWWMRDVRPLTSQCKRHVRWDAYGRNGIIDCMCQYRDGKIEAFLIRRKNFDSLSARSKKHPLEHDLDAICAMTFLCRNNCPQANVTIVFIEDNNDKEGKRDFIIEDGCPLASANVMRYRYSAFRDPDGNLNLEKLEEGYAEALSAQEKDSTPPYCGGCSLYELCKIKEFSSAYWESTLVDEKDASVAYRLPVFTPTQEKAIEEVQGPVILSCGPGSGKTAVLIGRTLHLMRKGVSPSSILLVTFTNKAAGEIRERISSYLNDGEQLPIISTLNALGYEILLHNTDSLGFVPKVATDMEKMQIAFNVLSQMPPIHGLNYSRVSGSGGLISRFVEMCGQYHLDPVRFEADYKDKVDKAAFVAAYEQYCAASESFIAFDDQIKICLELFEKHPNILSRYQRQYEYIMVDEFQDVNDACAEFVYQLAGKNRNLCVVGDDDQSIYAFNGGSNKHLVSFERHWNAKKIVIDENFRSTTEILSMASAVIEKSTEERIAKRLKASRSGEKPILMCDCTLLDLNAVIRQLKEKGVANNEIAIIATTNDALDSLHQALDYPTQIAKAYSCTDPVYGILRDVYVMYYEGLSSQLLYHMIATIAPKRAAEIEVRPGEKFLDAVNELCKNIHDRAHVLELDDEGDPAIATVQFLYQSFLILDAGTTSISAIRRILGLLNIENHIVLQEMSEAVAKDRSLSENKEMRRYLSSMLMFAQTSRMETKSANAIQLVTAHDSKGLEWRAVIIWGVEAFRVGGLKRMYTETDYIRYSETRRLLYVAMTRAKEYLYMMQTKPATGLNFVDELNRLVEGGNGNDTDFCG